MYQLPPHNILSTSSDSGNVEEIKLAEHQGDLIIDRLDELGMHCELANDGITIAPQVIRFDLIAAEKIAIRKIPSLSPEIAYTLGSESVVINAPSPGTKFVSIEIANPCRRSVLMGDVL